jgi:hypothetical protein
MITANKLKQYLQEGYIVIKVDKHLAEKTSAYTRWKIPAGILIFSTRTGFRTHWEEYWLVLPDETITRIRRSNRGNVYINTYKAKELVISEKQLNELLILLSEEI